MPTPNVLEPLTRIAPLYLTLTDFLESGVIEMHPEGVGQPRKKKKNSILKLPIKE
jgi:hypothetical protein